MWLPYGAAGHCGDLLDYVLDEGPKLRELTDIRELARVLGVRCGGFGFLDDDLTLAVSLGWPMSSVDPSVLDSSALLKW